MSETAAAAAPENSIQPATPSGQTPETATNTPAPQESEATATSKDVITRLQRGESPAKVKPEQAAPSEAPAPESKATPASEPVVDGKGRKHDPATGQFLPESGEESEVVGDPPAKKDEPAAGDPPADLVTIEVQKDHPLHHRLGDQIQVPKQIEEFVRWNLNNSVRKAEVEQAQAKIAELQEQVIRLQSAQESDAEWEQTPEGQKARRVFDEINAVDPEEAKRYWRGVMAERKERADARFQTAAQERIQQEVEAEGRRFQSAAIQTFRQALPPEITNAPRYGEHVQRALYLYGAELDRREALGERVAPDLNEAGHFLRTVLLQDPQVAEILRQKQAQVTEAEQKRIAAEAEEKAKADRAAAEKAKLEEQLQRRKTNPLGRLAVGTSTGQAVPVERAPSSREYIQSVLR